VSEIGEAPYRAVQDLLKKSEVSLLKYGSTTRLEIANSKKPAITLSMRKS
jgi:hypothetical protein